MLCEWWYITCMRGYNNYDTACSCSRKCELMITAAKAHNNQSIAGRSSSLRTQYNGSQQLAKPQFLKYIAIVIITAGYLQMSWLFNVCVLLQVQSFVSTSNDVLTTSFYRSCSCQHCVIYLYACLYQAHQGRHYFSIKDTGMAIFVLRAGIPVDAISYTGI